MADAKAQRVAELFYNKIAHMKAARAVPEWSMPVRVWKGLLGRPGGAVRAAVNRLLGVVRRTLRTVINGDAFYLAGLQSAPGSVGEED